MRFTLAVALLCPFILMAQPTITSDWVGKAGEEISSVSTLEVPDAGEAGADKSWDFSTVTPDTTRIDFKYVNPDTTPFFSSYPNSNSCLSIPEFGVYVYSLLDDNVWETHGIATGFFQKIYQDPQAQLMFPMNYEDSFTDEFASTEVILGITIYGTGNTKVTADAYGSVSLPGGTFDNVMRLMVVEESVDSTNLGMGGLVEKIHTTTTTYIWYSAEHPGPLCIRDYSETFQVGLWPPLPPDTCYMDPDSSFQYDPSATSSGIPYFSIDAFELEITPNPFASQLNLSFIVDNSQDLRFELQAINGQTVYTEEITASPGLNQLNIDVQGLPSGSYVAVLMGHNEGSIKQLVKIE